MFTTVAWSASKTSSAAYQKIAAVPDQHLKVLGDSVYINMFNRLIGAMALCGTTSLYVRMTSPRLRRLTPYQIQPIGLTSVTGAVSLIDLIPNRSIVLDIDEQLEVEFMGTAGAAEVATVIAWLSDGSIQEVKGEIFTAEATITITTVASAWTFADLNFVDDLPVGNYDVVGLDAVITDGIAIRLVPKVGQNRPGVPCRQLVSGNDKNSQFRAGNMGVFCSFPHNNIPGVEVITGAAHTATYRVFVDLIKK